VGAYAHPPPAHRGNACHTVPYGTDLLGIPPGTLCLATIVQSLRDAAPRPRSQIKNDTCAKFCRYRPHATLRVTRRDNPGIFNHQNHGPIGSPRPVYHGPRHDKGLTG